MRKKILLQCFIFMILLSIILVVAIAIAEGIIIENPVAAGNYTGTVNLSLIANWTDIDNVTCYYNSSGGAVNLDAEWINLTNSSVQRFENNSVSIRALNTSNIYNISCRSWNASNWGNLTSISDITFDSVVPNNSYSGGTLVDYANSSIKQIYINTTIGEPYVDKVVFVIYNTTGLYNRTEYTEGSGINYSKRSHIHRGRINITNYSSLRLPDGDYTYNVTVNDSSGNSNESATRTITIDTVDPVIVFNCSETSVIAGGTITCSCTATDAQDPIPTVSYDPTLDTSNNVGDLTTSCTATDSAANSAVTSIDYTVTVGSGDAPSSNTGGGTNTYTNTYAEDSKEFSEIKQITKPLKNNERIRILVDGLKHNIGVTGLTTNTITLEVFSTPQTATFSVGDTRKFDLNNDSYYDLSIILNKIESSQANLTLSSIYEKITQESIEAQEQEQLTAEQQQEEEINEQSSENLTLIIGIIVVILLVAGFVVYKYKFKKK